jgi:hypothetical protein
MIAPHQQQRLFEAGDRLDAFSGLTIPYFYGII